jgi:hypothetical protein
MKNAVFWDIKRQFVLHSKHIDGVVHKTQIQERSRSNGGDWKRFY